MCSSPLLKTFIVEDSALLRRELVATLEDLARVQVVGTAEDEEAALQWLDQHHAGCDLVLVDLFLKAGSGLGVLRRTTNTARPPHYVIFTNYATQDMRSRCLTLGAHRVFDKSTEIDSLLGCCDHLAELKAASAH